MNWMCRFLAGCLVIASSALLAQEQQVWVHVVINGKAVMGFVPAAEPSGRNERGVCSEVSETGARNKNGAPIRAFEFTGWKEGEHYRVLVFVIAPTGKPVSGAPCSEGSGFSREEFDSLRVRAGEEVTISKMRDVGLAPWVVRAGPKEFNLW